MRGWRIDIWLIIPDLHFPYHDVAYVRLIKALIKTMTKRYGKCFRGVVQLGDAVDFWQLSRYDKDPSRRNTIHDDLLMYSSQLDEWTGLMPEGSEYLQLEGNHEDRLRRYIWSKAPDIAKICPSVPQVLKFNERNKAKHVTLKWFPYAVWDACQLGDTVLHHGFYFNEHVAINNLKKYYFRKMITGHTHRFQHVTNGSAFSVSLGHGSDEKQTAHSPVPNGWQQAAGQLTLVNGNGHFTPVLVKDGACIYNGEFIVA